MTDSHNFHDNLRRLLFLTRLDEHSFAKEFSQSMHVLDPRTAHGWLTGSRQQHMPSKKNLEKIAIYFSTKLAITSLPIDFLMLPAEEFSRRLDELIGKARGTEMKAGTFGGESWVTVHKTPPIKRQIAEISELLDNIIEHTSRSNLPGHELLLTDIERQQLIAILETTLNVLKSPLMERGLFREAGRVLKQKAAKAAENGVQTGLGKLMELAADKLVDLIHLVF